MSYQAKRKKNPRNAFTWFWNEFLFAREYEYETPLTPDEIASELEKLDNQAHKSWFLSHSGLLHRVTYESNGDKAGDFKVELESKNRGKWWESKSAMLQSEGQITANQETGLTVIEGRTRFDGKYYLLFLLMFGANFFSMVLNDNYFFQIVWLVIVVAFWYSMYRERNTLANRIDDIIMNAKSEQSIANLTDNDLQADAVFYENELKRESSS